MGGEKMNKFLIIADDFTGANDTGVKLTEEGMPVNVFFSAINIVPHTSCVIDTETRNDPEKKAYEKVKTILNSIDLKRFDVIYKKVDSTLRGNIIPELKALSERLNPDYVVFAPALPALGRQVINKRLFVNGTDLKKTEFAHDPVKPVKLANVEQILTNSFGADSVQYYSLHELRSGQELDLSKRCFGFDTENDGDFAKITALFQNLKGQILWIGSSGLIEGMVKESKSSAPAIALVGSVSSKTKEQILYAQKNGLAIISLPIYEIYKAENYSQYVDQALQVLKEGNNLALVSSASLERNDLVKTKAKFKAAGISETEMEKIVQTTLAGICRRIVNKFSVSGLFVTGGATAQSILRMVKAQGTVIKEEVALGMPLLTISGGEFDGINMISKAGAFGDSSLIMFGLNKLRSLGTKEELSWSCKKA
ncbi:four-carbon acid sugar kinase family protein [Lactobacillus sp. XV13L]|nr:four-carbon acid sugar kinase family protein [Lactobacillus sp. XV13L]